MTFFSSERVELESHEEKAYRSHCHRRALVLKSCEGFLRGSLRADSAAERSSRYLEWETEWTSEASFLAAQPQLLLLDKESVLLSRCQAQVQCTHLDFASFYGSRKDARSSWMDAKVERLFAGESAEQEAIRRRSLEWSLPEIHVGAFEGRLLEVLLRGVKAKVGLELGTLGGYSASWILKAVGSSGKLYTIEKNSKHLEIARLNLEMAGLAGQVEFFEGDALELLRSRDWPELDFIFIDADRSGSGEYLRLALPLLKKGGLAIVDNAYLWGATALDREEALASPLVNPDFLRSTLDVWQQMSESPELCSLVLPTGDGLAVALKI
jgi:predicted O-methyltransferase YrrM